MPGAAKAAAPPRRRWADLRTRLISALVLLPLALGALYLGGLAWAVLLLVGGVGMALEWSRMCLPGRVAPAAAMAGALVVMLVLTAAGRAGLALASLPVLALAVWLAGRRRDLAAGVAWFGLPVIALVWLRATQGGLGGVLLVLLVVWGSDIGAYLAGRWIGGPRLAPAISPAKSWAGAAGGLLLAIAVAVALVASLGGAAGAAAVVAGVLSVLAQGGDLLESWVKRRAGVKDSGRLIPGHGGLLDRLDGVLTAAPAAAALAWIFGGASYLWK